MAAKIKIRRSKSLSSPIPVKYSCYMCFRISAVGSEIFTLPDITPLSREPNAELIPIYTFGPTIFRSNDPSDKRWLPLWPAAILRLDLEIGEWLRTALAPVVVNQKSVEEHLLIDVSDVHHTGCSFGFEHWRSLNLHSNEDYRCALHGSTIVFKCLVVWRSAMSIVLRWVLLCFIFDLPAASQTTNSKSEKSW